MLDFTPVRNKQKTIDDLAKGLTQADLRNLTNEMVDRQLALLADCVDADVVFVPSDPTAHDDAAADAADLNLAWTLGHVIVHATASSDEYSFIAAELARGVPFHGRSRAETPWQTVKTVAQCRQRLEESRRMRLASLEIWPDAPHTENTYQPSPTVEPINCVNRFIRGLSHDDSHLAQIADIARQARAARNQPMAKLPYDGATAEQLQHPLVQQFLAIHNMFRQELIAILNFTTGLIEGDQALSSPETASRIRALIGAGQQYTQYLHFHHHGETDSLFPALQEAGLDGSVVKRLNSEHDDIARLIEKFNTAIQNLATVDPDVLDTDLRRLADALQAHLAYEETHVCPFLTRLTGWPIE